MKSYFFFQRNPDTGELTGSEVIVEDTPLLINIKVNLVFLYNLNFLNNSKLVLCTNHQIEIRITCQDYEYIPNKRIYPDQLESFKKLPLTEFRFLQFTFWVVKYNLLYTIIMNSGVWISSRSRLRYVCWKIWQLFDGKVINQSIKSID